MMKIRFLFLCLLVLGNFTSWGQLSNYRIKTVEVQDTIQLDTLSIFPNSFQLFCGEHPMAVEDFSLDFSKAQLVLKTPCSGSLHVKYRVLPFDLSKNYARRDSTILYDIKKGDREKFIIRNVATNTDIFGGRSLSKSGSISRGITFGNNQNLGVNSSLNLELSGKIAPNLKLLASISDDNIPIQPEGNTNKLQEFDKIFIQLYNDRLKLIGGDFWIRKPQGYFLSYQKRGQGLTIDYQLNKDTAKVWRTQVSGALSKGKFQRQIIQGVEGNQGPYRLRGAQNEPFIIVLSGTERVFIDGKQLKRGQEYDYVIDYNIGEVVFTSRNPITKDVRIVVEFQYSDQNYARSLIQTSTTYNSKKMKFWLNGYSEQDAKNQSLQQKLTNAQKKHLSKIGDTLSQARISSVDSIGYIDNQNLYKIIDSLSYDSILVHSVSPDSAFYRATFEFVGEGKGNYVLSDYNALGKVFKWVAPVAGVSQGNYEPSRLIVTPKQRQMATIGASYQIVEGLKVTAEFAYSKLDKNTFSRFDRKDDIGVGAQFEIVGDLPLGKDSIPKWNLQLTGELEARNKDFNPIENYRKVEFDRDWNVRDKNFIGQQIASKVGLNFIQKKKGNIKIEGQQYLIGKEYQGLRLITQGRWKSNGFNADWTGSYLGSNSQHKNSFIRHKINVSQDLKWIKIGFKDDHEMNRFQSDILNTNSYQFFDYEAYVSNGDSIKNTYKLFFRERYDQRSDSSRLANVAKAQSIGGEVRFTNWKKHKLGIVASYRQLKISNKKLINQAPENTLLGRVEYEMRLFKKALTINNFYEIGSGLELRKEFLYIQVNDGQGVYTWVDYNNDGIKDLNEFEIAQYADQASYIRVFTPSNEYVRVYSNELNQSLFWRPERLWANKKGFLRLLSRFSNQTRVRIKRKVDYFDGNEALNPFAGKIRDTNLVSTSTNIRNTLFFNRTSSIVNANYTFQFTKTKTLLANGFDARFQRYHEMLVRWNIKRKFTLEAEGKAGNKSANADYTSGRNYDLAIYEVKPSFIYQPNTKFRMSLEGRWSEKKNSEDLGGELAKVYELGLLFKFNQSKKGSLQSDFKVIRIDYSGQQNSALGFEMLEALKPGINFTWSVGYQRSISKNLQMSIQYNGRKSENNKIIHAGGMEIRAFF